METQADGEAPTSGKVIGQLRVRLSVGGDYERTMRSAGHTKRLLERENANRISVAIFVGWTLHLRHIKS